MNIEEANKKIDVLDNKSWDLDAVISQVNDKTKEIKYNDVHSDIYIAVMGLAEDNGIEESELEYKIKSEKKLMHLNLLSMIW